jgi:hypothetical protein
MEIWIIGIPLVALMVYLSTRVKKMANQAYAEELIEREGFALIKPEGFIFLETPAEGFAFQAESKAFGENEATETIREASASVVIENGDVKSAVKAATGSTDTEVISQTADDCVIRIKENVGDAVLHVFRRIMNIDDERFAELTVSVLDESLDEFENAARAMVRSLRRN